MRSNQASHPGRAPLYAHLKVIDGRAPVSLRSLGCSPLNARSLAGQGLKDFDGIAQDVQDR
jgi:hypothetical protein